MAFCFGKGDVLKIKKVEDKPLVMVNYLIFLKPMNETEFLKEKRFHCLIQRHTQRL